MKILVSNAGSSSLKLRLLDSRDQLIASSNLPPVHTPEAVEGLNSFVQSCGPVDAAGHRVVHGGTFMQRSVAVTDDVIEKLSAASELAPLHNPPAVAALEACRRLLPGVPQIACFDTAFHATIPDAAAVYGVPWEWTEQWGVRRFGFHGLSHSYAARRAAEMLTRSTAQLRVVTCHLGAGASLAAVAGGRSVDTTMGFTPLEGLVMATRSGSVDPGILLWAERHHGLSVGDLEETLEHHSGVLGISGVSSDMRVVLEAAEAGNARARLAVDVYVHHLRGAVCAMASSMGGLDALVFTGGVGEGSAQVRAAACEGLGFLGVLVDDEKNQQSGMDDRELSSDEALVRVLIVSAREDLEIAREVRILLA